MFTRRRFLLTLPAFAVANRLAAQSFFPYSHRKPLPPPPPSFVYIGTDTAKGVSRGIYLCRFDPLNGHLSAPLLVAESVRPAYFAFAPPINGQRRLYVANEAPDNTATATSYLADPATGALREINHVTATAPGPAYISVDATGQSAFVADYAGSAVASYRILPNGALSQPVERLNYKDPRFGYRTPTAANGRNPVRQDAPHPHSTHLSPDNPFLLLSDLGSDELSVMALDPATPRLGPPALFSNDRPGSGPRHIAFHPNGRWVYSINEIDSTIDRFLWTTTSSRTHPQGLLVLAAGGPVKTIAPNFPSAKNTAAEIAVAPDGRFLYASNRGENSLVVFTIAPADGALTLLERIPCGGKTPRQFTLSPDSEARWLLCGNQDSASVTVFRRDPASGQLGGPIQTLPIDSPLFTLFA